jgi:hypothetical protein
MTSLSLHRLAGKILNKFRTDGISAKEDQLYDAVLSELSYRARVQRVRADQCTCMFCVGPFDGDEAEGVELVTGEPHAGP